MLGGARSMFSILATCVCVCKGCAAKIPSGQMGPPIDCVLSFFLTWRDVLGVGGGLWLQFYSPSPTLTWHVSS